mgnify:CR=1 FL=1
MAGAKDLKAALGVERGCVTAMSVVNDSACKVTSVLDAALLADGAPPLRMAPEHAIGVYCPPLKSTDDIQVQLCLQLGPAGPRPSKPVGTATIMGRLAAQ